MRKLLLSHDIGTSGNKATLYSEDGSIVASKVASYGVCYPEDNFAEQNADDWWRAVVESTRMLIKEIDPAEIAAVSFSGHMNGCLCVDENGKPLRNAILWMDTRASKEAKALEEKFGVWEFYKKTGSRPQAFYSIEKLMWVKNNQPEIYAKTYKMLQSKDYISLRFTGRFATDRSDASLTNAYDIKNHCWSKEIIDFAGIDAAKLPEILNSTDIVGGVTAEAAAETGLLEGTPVVAGAGDGSAATVGAGCWKEGEAYCCLGTSAWISTALTDPIMDEDMTVFNLVHPDPKLYVACGAMQSAGNSFNWMKEQICHHEKYLAENGGESIYKQINERVKASPVGANGLIFLPYLMGERSPWWDSQAKGAYIGITPAHTRDDMLRATVEGVALNLALIYGTYKNRTNPPLTLIGGLALSEVWRKTVADALGVTVRQTTCTEEASSMGAAVIAGVGAGIFKDFSASERFIRPKELAEPDMEVNSFYQSRLPVYKACYTALKDVFPKL
ncbi:MAG: xylulokinase [Oscillospiraceae bacterium]|nr:xylulokinase [Oscillospiraceae bacterium]MBQ9939682.1 xylulokinase [Oscillospiraceae bacterium]